MTLYLIGLGLKVKHLTLEAVDTINKCNKLYLENYTGKYSEGTVSDLEKTLNRDIVKLDRKDVEIGINKITEDAKKFDVGLFVFGDVLTATTHIDLIERARSQGIKVEIAHGISAFSVVKSLSGLQPYKFGKTTTIVYWENNYKPESFYDVIETNLENGLHTLCLMDLRAEEKRYMTINEAVDILTQIDEKRGGDLRRTKMIGIARASASDQKIVYGTMAELSEIDFGESLHSLIIPGKMHEMEEEGIRLITEMVKI